MMEAKQAQAPHAAAMVCSQDQALCGRLLRVLSHWAEEACVELALCQTTAWMGPPKEGGILFWDADSAPVLVPELLEDLPNTALVLLSANKQTAIDAYRYHPAAFLRPDAGYKAVRRVMDQCFPFWRQGLKWLDLPFRRERVRLPLCQLHCAEADGRETLLYCAGGQMRASFPLGKLWEELPSPPFIRCQRGFLVHLGAVQDMAGGTIVLKDDHREVAVSRQLVKDVQQALLLWRSAREG